MKLNIKNILNEIKSCDYILNETYIKIKDPKLLLSILIKINEIYKKIDLDFLNDNKIKLKGFKDCKEKKNKNNYTYQKEKIVKEDEKNKTNNNLKIEETEEIGKGLKHKGSKEEINEKENQKLIKKILEEIKTIQNISKSYKEAEVCFQKENKYIISNNNYEELIIISEEKVVEHLKLLKQNVYKLERINNYE
jgi:hypothetical protein